MRILLASSEVHPYSKTGGLADMVGSLGKALSRLGHEVTVVSPFYRGIDDTYLDLAPRKTDLSIQLGNKRVRSKVWERRISSTERAASESGSTSASTSSTSWRTSLRVSWVDNLGGSDELETVLS